MSRIVDAGLTHYWEEDTWRRLRRLRNNAVVVEDPCDSCPLELEHFYGSLILFGFIILCAGMAFLAELCLARFSSDGRRKQAARDNVLLVVVSHVEEESTSA